MTRRLYWRGCAKGGWASGGRLESQQEDGVLAEGWASSGKVGFQWRLGFQWDARVLTGGWGLGSR